MVEGFGGADDFFGGGADASGSAEMEAELAPILEGIGDGLGEASGERFEESSEDLGAGDDSARGLAKGDGGFF